MTRDERVAISILNAYKVGYESGMKDIEQEPCDDAISREAVMKIVDEEWICNADYDFRSLVESIEKLPPVTQKSGQWIDKEISNPDYPFQDRKIIECSKCHYGIVQARLGYTNYCPNCGAKMESEDKE